MTQKKIRLLLVLLLFAFGSYAQTPEDDEPTLIEGRVVLVPDGDQVAISKEGKATPSGSRV